MMLCRIGLIFILISILEIYQTQGRERRRKIHGDNVNSSLNYDKYTMKRSSGSVCFVLLNTVTQNIF